MAENMNDKLAGKKVFLVEDDEFFVKLVAKKLDESKCVFGSAGTGVEAMAYLQNNIPDVVILDLMLPGGLDGFGVLQKMKKDDRLKKIPVIILSNLSGPADIQKGMDLGAFRYL